MNQELIFRLIAIMIEITTVVLGFYWMSNENQILFIWKPLFCLLLQFIQETLKVLSNTVSQAVANPTVMRSMAMIDRNIALLLSVV